MYFHANKVQPETGEQFSYLSANVEDGSCIDVAAKGFWNRGQLPYFDVKAFNPRPKHTYSSASLPQSYKWAKLGKKRKYEECIREIEHCNFIPLVFSCSGGMRPLVTVVYKHIATLIMERFNQSYSMTLYWLRCNKVFPCCNHLLPV